MASPVLTVPPGLQFRVTVTQSIDAAVAAEGDLIKAKLATPIHDKSTVFIATGAPVTARIVQIRQYYGRESKITLQIALETVEVNGVATLLAATPTIATVFPKTKRGKLQQRVELGTLAALRAHAATFQFQLVSQHSLIPGGLASNWMTRTRKPAMHRRRFRNFAQNLLVCRLFAVGANT